jgi:hypothetical protein
MIKNQRHHILPGSKTTWEHNQKLLYSFEKSAEAGGYRDPKVAIIIGGSHGGDVHVGIDNSLPTDILIKLLHITIEGLEQQHQEPQGQPS